MKNSDLEIRTEAATLGATREEETPVIEVDLDKFRTCIASLRKMTGTAAGRSILSRIAAGELTVPQALRLMHTAKRIGKTNVGY